MARPTVVAKSPWYARVSRESRSLSTPISHTATGAPSSTTSPSSQCVASSDTAMKPMAAILETGMITRSTPLARRATSLVITETTLPSGARAAPPTGCSTAVERVLRSRCCTSCTAYEVSRFADFAAIVNATYRATSTPSHSTSCPAFPVARARSMATPITTGTADSPTCHTTASSIAGTVTRFTERITRSRNRPGVMPAPASYGGASRGGAGACSSTGSQRVRGPRPSPAVSAPGAREELLTPGSRRCSRPRS